MLKSILVVLTAMLMSLVPTTAAKPPLQIAEKGIKVDPIRMCAVKTVNGKLKMVGGWVPYSGFSNRSDEYCLFDCFGRAWGPGSTGFPAGGDTMPCSAAFGLGATSRWFFGGTYDAPNFVDDMTAWNSGTIESIGTGFWWLNDPTLFKRCILGFLLSEDQMDTTCTISPDSNNIYGGVLLDFGILQGTNAGYYFTDTTGLSLLGVTMPAIHDGAASEHIIIAEDFDPMTGVLTLSSGPCQFMLWGAGAIRNDGLNACGDQTSIAYVDDNPPDGALDAPGECYDYLFSVCPDPLGFMVAYGSATPTSCPPSSCPPAGTNSVTKTYLLVGGANNVPWSWSVSDPSGSYLLSRDHPGVAAGAAVVVASALALDLAAEATATGCTNFQTSTVAGLPAPTPAWPPATSTAIMKIKMNSVLAGTGLDLKLGQFGDCPVHLVNPNTYTNFNPDIIEVFLSGHDCNGNGEDDAIDIAVFRSNDLNLNGIPDECDCPPDFNQDGFVNGDDFDGYVAAFELGDAAADFNHDGFVNGDDFDSFVAAFEIGC